MFDFDDLEEAEEFDIENHAQDTPVIDSDDLQATENAEVVEHGGHAEDTPVMDSDDLQATENAEVVEQGNHAEDSAPIEALSESTLAAGGSSSTSIRPPLENPAQALDLDSTAVRDEVSSGTFESQDSASVEPLNESTLAAGGSSPTSIRPTLGNPAQALDLDSTAVRDEVSRGTLESQDATCGSSPQLPGGSPAPNDGACVDTASAARGGDAREERAEGDSNTQKQDATRGSSPQPPGDSPAPSAGSHVAIASAVSGGHAREERAEGDGNSRKQELRLSASARASGTVRGGSSAVSVSTVVSARMTKELGANGAANAGALEPDAPEGSVPAEAEEKVVEQGAKLDGKALQDRGEDIPGKKAWELRMAESTGGLNRVWRSRQARDRGMAHDKKKTVRFQSPSRETPGASRKGPDHLVSGRVWTGRSIRRGPAPVQPPTKAEPSLAPKVVSEEQVEERGLEHADIIKID